MELKKLLAAGTLCLLTATSQVNADTHSMPITRAQSISGHDLTLPSDIAGHRSVIVIGFSRSSQKSMEQWDKKIGAEVNARPGVPLYNIAVIQDAPKFIRSIITHGIKAIIPNSSQDHFLTVVQGQDELKRAVDFSGGDDAYVVILDASGKILFRTHGQPSDTAKNQVINQLKESE